jgi:hypothetical protein
VQAHFTLCKYRPLYILAKRYSRALPLFVNVLILKTLLQLPAQAAFSIKKSGLQTLDKNIGEYLKKNPSVSIDLFESLSIVCENLDWMAYYFQCTEQFKIVGAKCKDPNQPLSEYLKDKTTCPPTEAPTKAPTEPPATKGNCLRCFCCKNIDDLKTKNLISGCSIQTASLTSLITSLIFLFLKASTYCTTYNI